MKKTPVDIIIWQTNKASLEDSSSTQKFKFYFQNKKVGECSIRFCQNAYGLRDDKQFFPDNWFYSDKEICAFGGKQALLKPFLEITKFNFSKFQGQGFGRMGLQLMSQLSKKLGAEGRIYLTSQKEKTSLREPATFYEHCGFKGNEGKDGGKYFDPTPENIHILFSKPIHADFKIKEIPVIQKENSLINTITGQIKTPQKLKNILNQQRN